MREGGSNYVDGPLRDLIDEFIDDGIGELFNLSLLEYLDLPIPYLEIIRDKKDKLKQNRKKELDDILNSKNASGKK